MITSSLDKAKANLKVAKIVLSNPTQDNDCISIAAFLSHQALACAIEYVLINNHIVYPFDCDVDYLICVAKRNNYDLELPAYLVKHSLVIAEWVNETRYDPDYFVDYKEVTFVALLIEDYINTLSNTNTNYATTVQNIIDKNNLNISSEECLKLLPKQPIEDLEDLERLITLCAKSNYAL